jgi:hypothetical protein
MAMDANRFDRLTRSVATPASRRSVLAALGVAVAAVPPTVNARKRKRRKVRRNAFGCVDVGGFCKNGGQCCSGICTGKKGKKKCRAHDAQGCQPGVQDTTCDATGGADVTCTTSSGATDGVCGTTTGRAGYCLFSGGCFPCTKDAECQEFCGPRAACILCDDCTNDGGTSCVNPDSPSGCATPA